MTTTNDENDLLPGEPDPDQISEEDAKKQRENQRVRKALADVYTFVRSREINVAVSSFTFDHYIKEAIEEIKGTDVTLDQPSGTSTTKMGRAIRDAAGRAFDIRPSKLETLESMKESFSEMYDAAVKLAEDADEETEEESG